MANRKAYFSYAPVVRQLPVFDPDEHVNNFNDLVRRLVSLRRSSIISDKAFESLIKQITASFIEYEISERIEKMFEKENTRELVFKAFYGELINGRQR